MTRVNKITIYLDDKELAAIDGEDMTPDRFGGELIAFSDDNGRTCSLSRIRLFQLLPSLLGFVLGKQGEEIGWR